jgi:hypothetical protein
MQDQLFHLGTTFVAINVTDAFLLACKSILHQMAVKKKSRT